MADVGIRINATDNASGVFGKVSAEAGKLKTSISATEDGFKSLGGTAANNLGKMEMSAAATAAAMRQVPAQFTDIITSLQGGQKPLTVLLQQGGQLKDMFGGVGNATKALGTYVVGLVNPFTAAAAAAGVLGYAFLEGQKESREYQRVLLETGNAAGTTSTRLAASAANVAKSFNVTQGAAAGAIAALAGTNNVATESFEKFSGLAVKLNEVTGRAVGDTVKTMDELGKSPVEASIKLNDATHHLTASIYSQIKALQDQGKTAEAGALAQKAYFDAMNDRLPALEANLGTLERGWNALAKGAKGAWDAMLNIGRPTDPVAGASAALEAAQSALERAKQRATTSGLRGSEKENAAESVARLEKSVQLRQQELVMLSKGAAYEAQSAAYQKQAADQAEGRIRADAIHDKYLSQEQRMRKELAAAEAAYNSGPKDSRDAAILRESKARIFEQYTGEGTKSALAAQIQEYEDMQMEAVAIGERAAKSLAAQHAAQLLDDQTFYSRKREAALNANSDQQAVVELEKAAVASSGVKSAEKAAQIQRYNSELKKLREQALGIEEEYLNGLTAVAAKERKVQDDYITSLGKASASETKRLQDSVAAQTQHNAEIGKTKEQIEDYKRSVEAAALAEKEAQANAITGLLERNAALIEYGDTLGLIGGQAKEIFEEELKNLKEQIAERKKLVALYTEGAIKEKAAAASAAATAEWKRGWEETDRLGREVFTTWATDGTNAAQKIGDTLKKALLSAIYEATLKPLVFQMYTSIAGGGGGAAGLAGGQGGIGGVVNTASNLNTLYGAGSQFFYGGSAGASTASLGYANAVGTVGGDSLGALIAGNGGWSGVAVEGGAAAGTATSTGLGSSVMSGLASVGPIGLIAAAVIGILASRDATQVHSTGDSTTQYDATGKPIKRVNQHFSDGGGYTAVLTDGRTQEGVDATNAEIAATRDAHLTAIDTSANKYVDSLNAAYLAAAKNLGVGAVGTNFTFGSNDSDGGKFRIGASAGSRLFDSGDTALNEGELKLAASRAILTALEGSELPKYMQGVFDGVDAAKLDQAGIDGAIKAATDLKSAYEVLQTIPGQDLTDISYETLNSIKGVATELAVVDGAFFALGYTLLDVSAAGGQAAAGLAAAFGGLQAFQSQINAYAQNFLSPDEQQAGTYRAVQDELHKAGIDYTLEQLQAATRGDIRAVVEQYAGNVKTEEGAKQYAAAVKAANVLASVKPAMDKIAALPAVSAVGSSGGGGGSTPVQDAALSAWQDATNAIVETMTDLRTTLVGSGPDSFTKLQAQFAIEVASAKAGNVSAAEDLPQLVKTLADASNKQFTTSVERDVFIARLIETLGDVVNAAGAGGNLSIPRFAAGGYHDGGWAIVGEQGPELVNMPRARVFNAGDTRAMLGGGGTDPAVLEELRAVRAELAAIRASTGSTASSTGKTARVLDSAANGGQPLATKAVA